MQQFTKEQAIKFATSGAYKQLSIPERDCFQIQQKLLCMPFGEFHGAEQTLGEPIFTHQFSTDKVRIKEALVKLNCSPSFEYCLSLID
jgi:hypothetical protein